MQLIQSHDIVFTALQARVFQQILRLAVIAHHCPQWLALLFALKNREAFSQASVNLSLQAGSAGRPCL